MASKRFTNHDIGTFVGRVCNEFLNQRGPAVIDRTNGLARLIYQLAFGHKIKKSKLPDSFFAMAKALPVCVRPHRKTPKRCTLQFGGSHLWCGLEVPKFSNPTKPESFREDVQAPMPAVLRDICVSSRHWDQLDSPEFADIADAVNLTSTHPQYEDVLQLIQDQEALSADFAMLKDSMRKLIATCNTSAKLQQALTDHGLEQYVTFVPQEHSSCTAISTNVAALVKPLQDLAKAA